MLFGGRSTEILDILNYLHRKESPAFKDIILLYGQTGVGKSSLINAGLLPRLLPDWDIYYERKISQSTLMDTFQEAIKQKPRLLIIDHFSVFITAEDQKPTQQIKDFFKQLKSNFEVNRLDAKDKILVAIEPRYAQLLLSITENIGLKDNTKYLPKQVMSDLEYNAQLLRTIDEISTYNILLVEAIGHRHNLWELCYTRLANNWLFRYVPTLADLSLNKLLETLIRAKRKLIVLDQLEEVFTKQTNSNKSSLSNDNEELLALGKAIQTFLETTTNTKIILPFRVDFLAQIEDQLDQYIGTQYVKKLIKPLDEEGIKEAITTPLKGDYFELKYYEEFLEDMIYLMRQDKESNIAPALQIILLQLWKASKKTRFISRDLYQDLLRNKGQILEQFLKDQILKLENKNW